MNNKAAIHKIEDLLGITPNWKKIQWVGEKGERDEYAYEYTVKNVYFIIAPHQLKNNHYIWQATKMGSDKTWFESKKELKSFEEAERDVISFIRMHNL